MVFVGTKDSEGDIARASVYSSETDAWSEVIMTSINHGSYVKELIKPSLIGDTLYFTLSKSDMLMFDLRGRSLSTIGTPEPDAVPMMGDDGGLELIEVSNNSIYKWSHAWRHCRMGAAVSDGPHASIPQWPSSDLACG